MKLMLVECLGKTLEMSRDTRMEQSSFRLIKEGIVIKFYFF